MVALLSLTSFFVPIILAVLSMDVIGIGILIVTLPLYILALPVHVGMFTLYSVARIADTSWGNRISNDKAAFLEDVQVGLHLGGFFCAFSNLVIVNTVGSCYSHAEEK